MHEIARSLRSAERYLLTPPLAAVFGGDPVAICDISEKGTRFRHETPLEAGRKSILRISAGPGAPRLDLETVVMWTQPDPSTGKFVSGGRTFGPPAAVDALLAHLRHSQRTRRIEELRSTERFTVQPVLEGTLDGARVAIEDLSARGARVASDLELVSGATPVLRFQLAGTGIDVAVAGHVVWSAVKAINGTGKRRWMGGLFIDEKPEQLRLAIGRLCEIGRASLDPHSLGLKLRILRARARQLAPSYARIGTAAIAPEQYLLIQGVREELRMNPEEAMHWYRRARLLIADPATRNLAPPIAAHADALAVWEYLDRSIDPSIVARAFDL